MKYQYPFTNYIVFALVMRDPEICRGLLQLLFPDREIEKVKLHESMIIEEESDVEKMIILGPQSHSVRVDVLFTDSTAWYDIEMQVQDKKNLPKRTRYSHAAMDVDTLEPGKDYDTLKPGYVIFLCCFDCFGRGYPIYQFAMWDEEKSLPLGDGTYTIIVNSKAAGSVPVPLEELFRYMNDSEIIGDNELIRRIDSSVELWNSPERRRTIMTLEQEILIRENNARNEGREEIIRLLHEHGKSAEVIAQDTGLSKDEINCILEKLAETNSQKNIDR